MEKPYDGRQAAIKRGVFYGVLVTALAFVLAAGNARAETIRYIAKPFGDGRNALFDFQSHSTQTPFVGAGGTIIIPRSFGSSVFAYKHGIDITVVTLGAGNVSVSEMGRVNGVQSLVFMPTGVGNLIAKAGAIGYAVVPPRGLVVGSRHTVELRYPLGDKDTFAVEVGCHASGVETEAKFTNGTVADSTLIRGQETTLTLKTDVPARCGGQPLVINPPTCFKIKNPLSSQFVSSLSLTLEERDALSQAFTLKADDTCSTGNQPLSLAASLSGVQLNPRLTLTWVPTITLPPSQIKPVLPVRPRIQP